jgi:hypothetical protein
MEVFIASGVLAFVMLSLYGCFSFGFSTIRLSQENMRADQILVQKFETLRVYDWGRLTTGYIPANFTNSFSGTSASAGGVVYVGTIQITKPKMTESYADSLRKVTVTLDWVSGGTPRSRSMTTLVSRNGIQTYKP